MARRGKNPKLKGRQKKTGAIPKLAWKMCMVFCIFAVIYVVARQVKEQIDYPITSTIKTVPANKIPFPVVTFYSSNQEASLETFVEDLLNMFVFDCSYRSKLSEDVTVEDIERNRQCVTKSKNVRKLFPEPIQQASNQLFDNIQDRIKNIILKDKQSNHIYLLCSNINNRPIMQGLQHLAWSASTDNGTGAWKQRVKQVVIENFLLPTNDLEEEILMMTISNFSNGFLYNKSDSYLLCERRMKHVDMSTSILMSALDILAASSYFHMHLGTLLRKSSNDNELLFHNKMLDVVLGKSSLGKYIFSFDSFMATESKECCFGLARKRTERTTMRRCRPCHEKRNLQRSVDEVKKKITPGDFLKVIKLGISQFAQNHKKKEMWQKASEAAKYYNLSQNSLYEKATEYPQLWLCTNENSDIISCPHFSYTYTDRGYGFSMNMGNWEDTFAFENPHGESAKSNVLTSNKEIKLYLYNRETR